MENTQYNPPEQQPPVESHDSYQPTEPVMQPTMPLAPPGYTYQPPAAVAQEPVQATNFNKATTGLFALLILSVFTAPILFFPILIFSIFAGRKLFKDTSTNRKSTNLLIKIFVIIGWIAITGFIIIAALVAYLIITFKSSDAHCG